MITCPGNGRRASASAWRLGEWKGSKVLFDPHHFQEQAASLSQPLRQVTSALFRSIMTHHYDSPLSALLTAAVRFARRRPVRLNTCLHSCSHQCTLEEPQECTEIPFWLSDQAALFVKPQNLFAGNVESRR